MISTIIIGFVYNLLQMGFSIFTVVSGNRVLNGDGGYLFDFFGDKVHISFHNKLYTYSSIFSCKIWCDFKFKQVCIVNLHEQIISYFLISGSSAGFGLTVELRRGAPSNSFTDKAHASASLLLIGFLFTAIASTFTSFALSKKTNS